MLTSVQWLNQYLAPADLGADEAVRVLEAHAFPIESIEPLPSGDARLDVELTSNRGDAFSHLNLARDIAAATGRTVKEPAGLNPEKLPKGSGKAADLFALDNRVPKLCPRFTARLIKSVTVGPSPDWLKNALESVGQRSINNVVDVSNFVLFELGHPSHTFDLAKLSGSRLIIRHAEDGESLTALDERKHKLNHDDLVVADEQRPVSLAGVIGGLGTGVTDDTTDVLLELATWHPATVRNTARRLRINTDAAYRFARTVDPRELESASARAAQLIIEVAGGELIGGPEGLLDDGADAEPLPSVTLRPERINAVLGIDIPTERTRELLKAIDVQTEPDKKSGHLTCAIPPRRNHDLTREIDLIEEVARLHGFDHMQVADSLPVQLELRHPREWDEREHGIQLVHNALTAAGCYETVTFSFLPEDDAEPFLPAGMRLLIADRERRPDAPALRPSIIPSLLQVRLNNQNAQNNPPEGVRLYEIAAVFAELNDNDKPRQTAEHRNVAILMDTPVPTSKKLAQSALQRGVRELHGIVAGIVRALAGPETPLEVKPAELPMPGLKNSPAAELLARGERIGYSALIQGNLLERFGLERPAIACELGLPHLLNLYPPAVHVQAPPAFPSIERDLSLIVTENTPWRQIESLINDANPERLVSIGLIETYRGKPIEPGKKSVTLRLLFRDPERTLRHEEVDPQMTTIIERASAELGAEVRA